MYPQVYQKNINIKYMLKTKKKNLKKVRNNSKRIKIFGGGKKITNLPENTKKIRKTKNKSKKKI